MARAFIRLGQVPANESRSEVGSPNYSTNAVRECKSYVQAIRNYLGQEPDGAELHYRWFEREGVERGYVEAVCYYDPMDKAAVEYALRCEAKVPLTESQEYDLIVDWEGHLRKVQVKTTRNRTNVGSFKVELRTRNIEGNGKHFDSNKIDFLFAVTADGCQYLIPSTHLPNTRSIDLGKIKHNRWLVGQNNK